VFEIDQASVQPYLRLKAEILRQIRHGELRPGDRLPSIRSIRSSSGLSLPTIVKATKELVGEGILRSEVGRGTFVASDTAVAGHGQAIPLNVGIVVAGHLDPHGTPFQHEIMQGLCLHGATRGHRMILRTLVDEPGQHRLDEQDAYVILQSGSLARYEFDCPKPLVFANRFSREPDVPHVNSNNDQGMRDLLRELAALGHRRFALLATSQPEPPHACEVWRREAFVRCLGELGSCKSGQTVFHTPSNIASIRKTIRRVLNVRTRPTAIVCVSDDRAVLALQALEELGVRVPEEISVVGFGGLGVYANLYPPLSTVDLCLNDMGRCALDVLEGIVSGRRESGRSETFPTVVRLRGTTGPAPVDSATAIPTA